MSNYEDQYEGARSRNDEYGNPVHGAGMTGGAHGAGGYGTAGAADPSYGGMGMQTGHHGQGAGHEQLRRSGSSSSSSSEDDGQGGRRKKKGLKEKIKEKLPGGEKTEQSHMSSMTPGQVGEGHEKKGIMEKIKEKLPGHHDDQPRS